MKLGEFLSVISTIKIKYELNKIEKLHTLYEKPDTLPMFKKQYKKVLNGLSFERYKEKVMETIPYQYFFTLFDLDPDSTVSESFQRIFKQIKRGSCKDDSFLMIKDILLYASMIILYHHELTYHDDHAKNGVMGVKSIRCRKITKKNKSNRKNCKK